MLSFASPASWKTWDEWFDVFHLLFSEDEKDILKGCAKVSAWMAKQPIPVAIEVTGELQSELHGKKNVDALSLAIIRFINGVVEPYKDTNISSSIQNVCEQCKIPDHIITIRHMATHGKMPTYEFAVVGAKSALAWLKENYWEEQANIINNYKNDMRNSLVSYLNSACTDPFNNFRKNFVLAFGVPELVKLLLNDGSKCLDKYGPKMLQLFEAKKTAFPFLGNAVTAELLTCLYKGNEVAKDYFSFLYSSYPVNPDLIEWNPTKPWPETSIGNMPIDKGEDLTLDVDDIGYATC